MSAVVPFEPGARISTTPTGYQIECRGPHGVRHYDFSSVTEAAEFDETFGESCTEAADAVAFVSDVMRPADLASLTERVALTVADAIKTATLQVGVAESPWVRQGQRWAVEAYFARISEVRVTMVPGGRA